jgi:DNA-binding response OmpR family regulator
VEDEWLVASEGAKILERAGARVIGPAANLDVAFALLDRFAIDAAILDINLGGEMVFAIADFLHAIHVPFAFVSGYPQQVAPDRFAAYPFYEKPADLAHALRVLLERAGQTSR